VVSVSVYLDEAHRVDTRIEHYGNRVNLEMSLCDKAGLTSQEISLWGKRHDLEALREAIGAWLEANKEEGA
jgi:hypothetical protein